VLADAKFHEQLLMFDRDLAAPPGQRGAGSAAARCIRHRVTASRAVALPG
jgi:hypothetical protein